MLSLTGGSSSAGDGSVYVPTQGFNVFASVQAASKCHLALAGRKQPAGKQKRLDITAGGLRITIKSFSVLAHTKDKTITAKMFTGNQAAAP